MKKLYKMFVMLLVLFSASNIFAQGASVTWPLTSTQNPNTPLGNIQGNPESIGPGPSPTMVIFSFNPYTSSGQQLWVGNTGWIAGPLDITRYIQFDASPTSGNNFTVTNVSFNYGDDTSISSSFNIIKSQVFYSTDNWVNSTQLSSNPLDYLHSNMQSFNATGLNIPVANGQTFSLRIYLYAVQNGSAAVRTLAVHNNVIIEGTTESAANSGTCTDFTDSTAGGWHTNNAVGTILQDGANYYYQTTDQSGTSTFFNDTEPLTGDWNTYLAGGCGSLCWDVNYLFAGNGNDGSSQPITITPTIRIEGNGFAAYFLTNNLITAGDGWHSYCAPLSLINPGDPLPSNSEGHWVMITGTNSDWNSMLSNITMLRFSIDPTSYQSERFGFDNICLSNTGDCNPPATLCDSLSATAARVTPGDCVWSLSLNQPADLTGISSIQILSVAPNQFTTGTGLGTNYQTWFTSGTNTYTPPNGIVPGGNLNDFFNMSISYVTSPQVVVVNWLNDSGGTVCSDTLNLYCDIECVGFISDTVTCVGSNFNLAFSFANNATYSISNIEYTLQSPNTVTITPLTVALSSPVIAGTNSGLQNILITGAVPGQTISIKAKFISGDGCCWCYDSLSVVIPECPSVCDSLIVQAQGSPEDCCYTISLTNNSSMVFSNVEFELLSGGMYSTVATTSAPGWGFTNVFPNNLIKLVKFPIAQGIGNGTFSNILDMCIRQYSSPNQVVEVRWIKDGNVICRDTLRFECVQTVPEADSCSQAINGVLECLPDGTFQYKFRVQNNSNIISTGYGIYPTTPGVTFSQTIFNTSILPGQVSPMDSIVVSGIGSGENLCFQTAIFTVVPGENAYNYCCHSDTMCVTTPICEGQTGCVQPPTGMVAWWPFDETSGTTSLDLAGFNNAGTQINGPVPVAGKVLGGLQFDGINDYIEVPDHSELDFGTGNFSIDAWVQTNQNTGQLTIVNKIQFPLNRGYSLYLSNGEVRLILSASSYMFYVSSVNVADGNWHHIAVTVDRTDPSGIKFYKDGIMISSSDPTTNPGTITAISPLRIGTLSFTVGDMFKGSLDEIELFNRVLTIAEIQSIYNAGSAGKCKPDVQDTCLTKVWSSLGPEKNNGTNGEVYALAVSGTDIYVGGWFTSAGGVSANYVAKWNGTNWSALGSGLNGYVDALTIIGTDLYAGGDFTIAGSVSASHVAKWNGTTWSALGSGINGTVNAFAVIGTDLYAGGSFSSAGSVTANSIAKWNGTTWSALGTGTNGYLYDLAVIGTDLYAGGVFSSAGSTSASRVAKWNGTSWSALGSGISSGSAVTALSVMGGNLYVGGDFALAGSISVSRIAKWDGTNWSALGNGVSNDYVKAFVADGTDLYVGGGFTTAGSGSANRIAKWDGTNWTALGTGMNQYYVNALVVMGGDLYAGGAFTTAGNVNANNIAKYSCGILTSVDDGKRTDTLPQQFLMEQNYPNPFNPASTIRYIIPQKGFVKISVYDVLGREISVLVNEEKNPGRYEIIFDAKELSSGIYFYTIRTGEFTQSKKMILMK